MAPIIPPVVDVLNPRLWKGILDDIPLPMDYQFAGGVMPERSEPADKLMWNVIKAENPMANFVAINAESSRPLPPQSMATVWANALYIRAKADLDESDLRNLKAFGDSPYDTLQGAMAAKSRDNLVRTAKRLKGSIEARKEWLALNALLGDINVTSGDVIFRIQYNVAQATANILWNNVATSDPALDIQTWFKDNYYFTMRHMYLSRDVMFNLIRNTALKGAMSWSSGQLAAAPASITNQRVSEWFQSEFGLSMHIYDVVYTTAVDSGGTTSNLTTTPSRILPTNKVLFLPEEEVGYLATTPALLNNWQPGYFAWTVDPTTPGAQKDPPVFQLGAGWYGFPVIEYPNKIFVGTVA